MHSSASPRLQRLLSGVGLALALAFALLFAGCTDRLAPTNDRWGQSGELIAMSGGEGGARYACMTCHGARGEGNGFDAPRLAGLPAGYLQKQMEDFAAGLRPHEVMRDAARFLDSDERVRVANHYAAMPAQAMVPATLERADVSARTLYAKACEKCHGVDGRGAPGGPPLNAQPAFYLIQQLQDWQASQRRNDGGHAMLEVAQTLDAGQVNQLGLYLAAIPLHPAPAAR